MTQYVSILVVSWIQVLQNNAMEQRKYSFIDLFMDPAEELHTVDLVQQTVTSSFC